MVEIKFTEIEIMFRRNFLKNIGMAGAITAMPAQNLLAVDVLSDNNVITGNVYCRGNAIIDCIVSDG